MHLAEVLRLRAIPAAGVCLEVTRRCPLKCAHCFTNSSMASPEPPADRLLRFAGTLARRPPSIVLMSGGEPLLRPRLVAEIAGLAKAAGARSYVLSGAYFATRPRIPAAIRTAIKAVDHFAVSMDPFHEPEVPRTAVLALLDELLSEGTAVSVQTVDGQAEELTALLRDRYGDRVPVLVTPLIAAGRAADRRHRAAPPTDSSVTPCALAAWPVVTASGAVTACCNEQVVAGAPAPHLRLGHIDTDDWPEIRRRTLARPMLRALRTFGPGYLAARWAVDPESGHCATCRRLPAENSKAAAELDAPFGTIAQSVVAASVRQGGAAAFARRYGVPEYAELVVGGEPAHGPDQ
ncbi:radical SAM protein [Streptomyces sp. NBC_00287]|uniref:radical SAM protein n=1 Tax=Streptomyces sp. NBC_00287 TaxID=2975702 RepID=UPI002E2A749C|nr:radical SAM protein [Streptomyces sp. NBC_00287]